MSKAGICVSVLALVIACLAFVLVVIVWAKPTAVLTRSQSGPAADNGAKDDENNNKNKDYKEVDDDVPDKKTDDDFDDDDYSKPEQEPDEPQPLREKTYIFGMTADGRFTRVEEQTGDGYGLHVDFIKGVCKRAGKKCEFYVSNQRDFCFNNDLQYSEGLWHNWFDACAVARETNEGRMASGFFGKLINLDTYRTLYARTPDAQLDPTKVKIGFHRSFASSPFCLRSNGIIAGEIVYYKEFDQVINGLITGEVDLALLTSVPNGTEIYPFGDEIVCGQPELSLMTRKEKLLEFSWFDEHLDEMKKDGTYTDICRKGFIMYDIAPRFECLAV